MDFAIEAIRFHFQNVIWCWRDVTPSGAALQKMKFLKI